jgi:hypothetical protein
MGSLELTLAAATFLGGVAALWFFWDKVAGWWTPRARPAPQKAPVDKWVDLKYPSDSGLQKKLEADGYRVVWCLNPNFTLERTEGSRCSPSAARRAR